MNYFSKVCTAGRFERIEEDVQKVRSIQDLIETTVERLDDFANKSDMDKLLNQMDKCVKSQDFDNFLEEYNDYKTSMIDENELKVLQNELNTLQKNA